jgi:superoxide dismutase, Cu-Zn family
VKVVLGLALAAAVAHGAIAAPQQTAGSGGPLAVALHDMNGKAVGEATLTPAARGVTVKLRVWGLQPGPMAFHIHQHARCEPPEFNSAGLHFDPGGVYYNNVNHEHDGVLAAGNPGAKMVVGADGTAEGAALFPNVTMGTDDHSVFTDGGTAIIVHQDTSRMHPDTPTRTACGVIVRPKS